MALPFFLIVQDHEDDGRDFQVEITCVDGRYRLHADIDGDAFRPEEFASLSSAIGWLTGYYPEPSYSISIFKAE